MKVYAEYRNNNLRKKTLLQFGESIELIGSAVLMNPGSAEPKEECFDINIIHEFYKKLKLDINIIKNDWKIFYSDDGMKQVEKIFNGYYIKNEIIRLNGIIQLFNCFYYMNADRNIAKKEFSILSDKPEYIFDESKMFSNKPVYFGWGVEGLKGKYRNIAEKIFNEYNCEYKNIYEPDFDKNEFYHPAYINKYYRKNEGVKNILYKFYGLLYH